jgi:LuxR family maltose regulon positive regulatory protein
MLESEGARLGLVVAPAGFGKSTLLAQWARSTGRRVAWVTLDHNDADPVRFWTHAIAALERALPGSFDFPQTALAVSSIDEFIVFVTNRLGSLGEQVTLILDDYHEVGSDEVDTGVGEFVADLPAGSSVVISSRHDPGFAVARWRASEQLIEIRQQHLRFDGADARAWLANHPIELSTKHLDTALAVTEGWPAAFTLALRSAMRSSDPVAAVTRFSGKNRHVSDYIREEVLGHHREDLPTFFVASVCPRVCPELVDHALGIADARARLRRIERSGMLLESLDDSQSWFRLHRLVADYFLATHRRDEETSRWTLRAAEWFAQAGFLREALDLALEADRHDVAVWMISQSWIDQVRRGEYATLRADLGRIAPDIAAGSAAFLVTRAWLHAFEGRSHDANADLERAARIADDEPLPDGCPSVEAASATINSLYAINGGFEGAVGSARRADELVDETSDWRPLVDLGIGYSAFMVGELETAHSAFDRALASSDPLLATVAVGWNAVIDVLRDDLTAAKARLEDGAQLSFEDAALSRLPAVVVARAAVDLAEGNPIKAAERLDECRRALGSSDPTDRLEVLIWLTVAEAAIGRSQRARQWIDAAEQIIRRYGGSEWHQGRLRQTGARLEPAAAGTARDPGLTSREQRILQLLSATHLSQREIGAELGISFNTIKSHVKTIYVKLGATSREEASQIARFLRLV